MLRLTAGWLGLLLVCVPLWTAAPISAQEPTAPAADAATVEEARRQFAEGITFVEREDWVSAEQSFRNVLALRSSHVVAYNLASALVHLERLVEAAELLRSILRASDVDAQTREVTQQLLSETEPRIGTLTVRVSGDASGAHFTLDGKPIELTAQVQTIAVDSGEHQVVAERDGGVLASAQAAVGHGGPLQAEVELALPALIAPQRAVREPSPPTLPRRAASAPSAPSFEDESSSGSSVWWWAGGGAVVAAATAVTLVLVLGAEGPQPVAGDTDPPFVRGRIQ